MMGSGSIIAAAAAALWLSKAALVHGQQDCIASVVRTTLAVSCHVYSAHVDHMTTAQKLNKQRL